jgi:hypothetical protein
MRTFLDRLAAQHPALFSHTDLGRCDCPPGWELLVSELCVRLTAEHPQARCVQLKDKFGALRFYVVDATDETRALIAQYEARSLQTCERCGAAGMPRYRNGWHATLCDEHVEG